MRLHTTAESDGSLIRRVASTILTYVLVGSPFPARI